MKFSIVLSLASFASIAQAQLKYLDVPQVKFEAKSVPSVGPGCGAFVAPDDAMVVVTSSNCQVSAFDVESGDPIFAYSPSSEDRKGRTAFCTSGVSFGRLGDTKYLVTGVSYGFQHTANVYCQIVALLPDGNLFWKSSVFNGACSGTPVIGEDGSFVYFTRNTIADGYFTILAADLDGIAYFDDHTQPRPFAPPGIYHNPAEGYYLGGAGNTNDLVIFASTGFYGEMGVDVGSLFAFQLPLLDAEPAVTLMNNASSWYSFSAPKITNSGYSMYMTSSRNQFRAWVGSVGDKTNQFHKLSTETVSFPRAIPAWLAPTASVALSNSPSKPMVFGGAATDIMVGYTFDMKEMWTVASSSSIQVAAKVSTQDDRVYWVEENGMVHSSNTASGIDFWAVQLSTAPVRSDFAQTSDGSTLFFTDVDGNMIAWSVAVVPTRTPTTAPTGIFSPSPSSVLTKAPTTRSLAPLPKASSGSTSPSAAPSSAAPSAAPSAGQSAAVTSDPTITAAPVSKAPTKLITPVPSAEPSSLPTSTPTVRTQAPTVLNTSTPTSGAAATMALSSFVFILLLLF